MAPRTREELITNIMDEAALKGTRQAKELVELLITLALMDETTFQAAWKKMFSEDD